MWDVRQLVRVAAIIAIFPIFIAAPFLQAAESASPKPILLWPEGAPGAKGTEEIDKPSIRIYQPTVEKRNGTAVVICPGGGYGGLAISHEGTQVANWFNSFGITGIVLKYRLGPKYHHPIEMNDAKRAVRYIRAHAKQLHINPDKIGIMGFSAGGHLASTVATHFDAGNKTSQDPIDHVSSRPDFAVLGYPVILSQGKFAHKGSFRNLLGKEPDPKLLDLLSNEKQVTKRTPPTFLFHTSEDKAVPVQNSLAFYSALMEHGVAAEMHIYQQGPHGVGMANGNPVLSSWTERLKDWMKITGLLSNFKRTAVKGKILINSKEQRHRLSIVFIPENQQEMPAVFQMLNRGSYSITAEKGPVVGKNRIEIWDRDSDQAQHLTAGKNLTIEVMPGLNVFDLSLHEE